VREPAFTTELNVRRHQPGWELFRNEFSVLPRSVQPELLVDVQSLQVTVDLGVNVTTLGAVRADSIALVEVLTLPSFVVMAASVSHSQLALGMCKRALTSERTLDARENVLAHICLLLLGNSMSCIGRLESSRLCVANHVFGPDSTDHSGDIVMCVFRRC